VSKTDAARDDDALAPGVHNQSVLKAVALIGCFVNSPEGKTLTELARQTQLNVSTAYRMLQTLVRTGILRRDQDSDRFLIGPLLLALAGATFSSGGYGVVQDMLRGMADETGESVSLSIRDEECVAVLLSAASTQGFRFEHRAGERIPVHCSAMGKALLAFGDHTPAEAATGLGRLMAMTPKSITRTDRLVAELDAVRARGYAVGNEEHHLGVRSIALPIMIGNSPARAALGLQAPVSRLPDEKIADLVTVLSRGAELISRLPFMDRLPVA
jgi:IclR family acetate operon transcriptional repressor